MTELAEWRVWTVESEQRTLADHRSGGIVGAKCPLAASE